MNFRVGLGYDVHTFVADTKLILGGIEIPCNYGLKGHSDADALLHAITDAILGAAALGDIGTHFPDTDPEFKDADSFILLKKTVKLVHKKGYKIGNSDSTIIAEQPKMQPHINAMRSRIAEALMCEEECVSIKATTHEKMGALGRMEGIAVHSIVLLNRV